MINYLLNKAVDKQKYDACISQSLNAKAYAYSWYLDSVADDWDVLVLNDYESVMPLPKRKKYGINYVYQPNWIQHLGIFSSKKLTDKDCNNFIEAIPSKFKLVDFNVNFKFKQNSKFESRLNYVLPLQSNFEGLFKSFSKRRKRSILKAQKSDIAIEETTQENALLLLCNDDNNLRMLNKSQALLKLESLIITLKSLDKLIILETYSKDKKLLGGAFFVKSDKRYILLLSVLNDEGRKLQAMSLLLSEMIRKHSNSSSILDFEGSMLPGVGDFYQSFSPQIETYYHYKSWKLF